MVFGSDAGPVLREIEARLDGIYRLLEIQTRPQIEAILQKLSTTKERRKVWILCNGERKTEDIARLSGNSLRSVQLYVQEAERLGLMDTSKRGCPRRRFNVTPTDWSPLIDEIEAASGAPPQS